MRFRWALLLLFPVGFALTYGHLGYYWEEYLFLTLLSTAAAAGLLLRLRSFQVSTWPLWIVLGAFLLGYYLKFYALVILSHTDSVTARLTFTAAHLARAADANLAVGAFRLTTVGFVVFCTVFFAVGKRLQTAEEDLQRLERRHLSFAVKVTLALGVVLLLATTLIAVRLQLLSAAVVAQQTSFRLAGWLFYARSALLVVFFLFLLQSGLRTQTKTWTRLGIALLIGLALTEVLVRTTRAGFVVAALGILFSYALVNQRMDRRALRIFAVLFAVAVLLFPITTQYRILMRGSGAMAGLPLFLEALGRSLQSAELVDTFWFGLGAMLSRFIGVDSLLFLTDPDRWLGLDGFLAHAASSGSVASYFTHQIVGVPRGIPHAEAPSLLGWFVITGGWWGLTVGFAAYLLLGWALWMRLWRIRLLVRPVAQVQFLLLWLTLSSEGTLDTMSLVLVATGISIAGCEILVRAGYRRWESWSLPAPVRDSALPAGAGPPRRTP